MSDSARSKPAVRRLGDLQLQILKILWTRAEATVAEVHQSVTTREPLAYTTIATMLRKMESRGLVGHRTDGRTFVYRAAVSEDQVTRGMAGHVLDRLFEGRLSDLVQHLLTSREISAAELDRLDQLIAARRKDL